MKLKPLPGWSRFSVFILLIYLFAAFAAGQGQAAVVSQFSFKDPGNKWGAYHSVITANLQAAIQDWGQYFPGTSVLHVQVSFVDSPDFLACGASAASALVTNRAAFEVFEQAVARKLRTGEDLTPNAPDITLQIGTDYLVNTLWFDPAPTLRTNAVPADKIDAMSVFLHETGHALGFNGWMNATNGTLPSPYMSTFDQWVSFDGDNFYFNGPNASANHGGPVPVTFGNAFHLANESPRPGGEVVQDLMNGVAFTNGVRYYISRLDLDIMADLGVPIKVPSISLSKPKIAKGEFQFQVRCPRARKQRVEVSADLVRWETVMDYASTATTMLVALPHDPAAAKRFYRVVVF